MGLLSILSGPIGNLIGSVGSVIDNLHTSDEEKLAAKHKLQLIELDFQRVALEAETKFVEAQRDVLKTEISSKHWLAANWRPILMLVFTYIIFHNYVLVPIFGLVAAEIPADMWTLLKIGVGGYIVGRSAEKIVPSLRAK